MSLTGRSRDRDGALQTAERRFFKTTPCVAVSRRKESGKKGMVMNRVSIRRFMAIALVLALTFSLTGCKSSDSPKACEDPKFIDKTVEEIAVDYGTFKSPRIYLLDENNIIIDKDFESAKIIETISKHEQKR